MAVAVARRRLSSPTAMVDSAFAPSSHQSTPASFARSVRAMLRLALPVVLVQVGWNAMGVADTIMVGHYSATALAAVALGNMYFFAITLFGNGVLLALDPVIAQAVGARDYDAVARGVQRGLLIAIGLTVLISLVLLPTRGVLTALSQPPAIIPDAAAYARVSIPGVFPFLAFIVLRQSLQAMGRTAPIVGTIVAANACNIVLNWVLVFGHLGMAPRGAVGSALATSVSRWFMALTLLVVAWRQLRPVLLPWRAESVAGAPLIRMLALGLPIGAQYLLEVSTFTAIGLLMGRIGTIEMAGHQIALNLASFTFMVPLGVSAAAAVLVGRAIGHGDPAEARRAAAASLLCGAGFMALSAIALRAFPWQIAGLYSTDRPVAAVAALLIPIAGIFQLFDGIQVVSIGVLRGTGDTRTPMLVNVLGFWLLGIPVSVYFGFRAGAGPAGLWWGLVVGLAAVAIVLLVRVRSRFRGDLRRITIEEPEPSVV